MKRWVATGLAMAMLAAALPAGSQLGGGRAVRERADILLVVGDPLFHTPADRIPTPAARSRLPAMYISREVVRAGGLASYGPDIPALFRRAAGVVDRILRGAKPADLPVEQPTQFELVVNLKAARALGLTVPQTVLLRATEVIP